MRILDKIERYTIIQEIDGISINMSQVKNAIGVGLTALIAIFAIWYFVVPNTQDEVVGKVGSWVITIFLSFIIVLSLVGMLYKQKCKITNKAIIFEEMGKREEFSLDRVFRVVFEEYYPRRSKKFTPRYRIFFQNKEGKRLGSEFQFWSEKNAHKFLKILQLHLSCPVEKSRKEWV